VTARCPSCSQLVRGLLVLAIILLLIIVWIAAGIIGAVVHGLIWLTIIAAVLFLATLVFGGTRLCHSRAARSGLASRPGTSGMLK
jgi:hypothetical protein